jgi:hypothetical protein
MLYACLSGEVTWEGDWILLAGRLGQAVEGKKVEVLANSNSASTHLHLGDLL